MSVPNIKLNNGFLIPNIGIGTWQAREGEVKQAVRDAIDLGYRHIDTAFLYSNEKEIGEAIKEKIAEGVVKREDLFITTKLWNTDHQPHLVVDSCRKSLKNLGLDYVDLYLIHWPVAFKRGGDLFPKDANGKFITEETNNKEVYKQMEECVKLKLTRSIGLSNFNSEQIEDILSIATIKPVCNQVECNVYLNQKKLIEFCKQHDIVVVSYCPLGQPNPNSENSILNDPKLKEVAAKKNKSVAQVILRYLVQVGTIPIPKSVNKNRLKENLSIFDFELSSKDIEYLDTFNINARVCPFKEASHDKNYPFSIEF